MIRRAWRAAVDLLNRGWLENHATMGVIYGLFAADLSREGLKPGFAWRGWGAYFFAVFMWVLCLRHLKAYLWEDMRFELIRPGGTGSGGENEKPETAAPVLPITKEEMRCN